MRAEPETYLLRQTFRYDYATPARRLRHRLVVVPRAVHGGQVRLGHGVAVTGAAAKVVPRTDRFGNVVVDVRADRVEDAIVLASWARVRHDPAESAAGGAPGTVAVPVTAAADPRLLAPTPLTTPDRRIWAAAHQVVAAAGGAGRTRGGSPGGSALAVAERACTWAHEALSYGFGATTVHTTAAQALVAGQGVCQDYAHVMLAVCRAAGVAARYVSGHLVGEGGSHAWVEAIVADPCGGGGMVAVPFDPTHDRRAVGGYVTVAVGRDYTDVAPTSGRFQGDSPGVLTACKTLVREGSEAAARR